MSDNEIDLELLRHNAEKYQTSQPPDARLWTVVADDFAALVAEVDRLRAETDRFATEGYDNMMTSTRLRFEKGHLKDTLIRIRCLDDNIPDDGSNGDYGLGWDLGYNAALKEVRAIAREALHALDGQEGS